MLEFSVVVAHANRKVVGDAIGEFFLSFSFFNNNILKYLYKICTKKSLEQKRNIRGTLVAHYVTFVSLNRPPYREDGRPGLAIIILLSRRPYVRHMLV
jgi:hypothetical protein